MGSRHTPNTSWPIAMVDEPIRQRVTDRPARQLSRSPVVPVNRGSKVLMAKRDIKLVELLIELFNSRCGTDYKVTAHPERADRTKKAVEAIATNSKGDSIAFEHTLLQPFVGDKTDTQPLLKVFAPLETDRDCNLREYDITVLVPVGAVRKRIDWKKLAEELMMWLRGAKEALPEGESRHTLSSVQSDLTISVSKTHLPGRAGKVFVGRSNMPDDLPDVIMTALRTKLPKLAAASASKRVLLLEKDSPPHGYNEIASEIERASAASGYALDSRSPNI